MEIRLFEVLGTDTLRHRDTAKIILNLVSKAPTSERIAIFSGIDFASHPFCHELRRGLTDRDATYLNMEPEVESMMRNVFKKPKIDFKLHPESKKLRTSSDGTC